MIDNAGISTTDIPGYTLLKSIKYLGSICKFEDHFILLWLVVFN